MATHSLEKPAGGATSLRNQAYELFCEQVLAARLRPGQFVSQQELTLLLGMPLGAIREMIPRLEAARLIVTVPKRGLQIMPVDLKLIRNAFDVRLMIEKEAACAFIRSTSDSELERIAEAHRAMLGRAIDDKPDPRLDKEALALDWNFHHRMVDVLNNEIISDMYRVNSLHIKLIRIDSDLARPMRVVPAMREHLAFIAALQARDEPRAVALICEHINASRQRVVTRAMGLQMNDGAPLRHSG
ncbi:GntR family transcriptional regulator [Pollutimonas sp. M17]|uniref:GntR family transcriptional regulator n=1 Tax=Pollutimonas sp. M17 TaxID=2962065 RepID=UPI0021F4A953|nr:GntR family transcriptional regulator [Pollutimonas sp. M17]UYO92789.1 GntR family transcriptional regulator [Pollutimonas sp. M17]